MNALALAVQHDERATEPVQGNGGVVVPTPGFSVPVVIVPVTMRFSSSRSYTGPA